MTSQNNLEIKGSLTNHSLAELLAELAETNLHGSLRVSSETNKAVVYINAGKPVFAASNHRRHKLFEILLSRKLVDQALLKNIENYTNDIELSQTLQKRKILSGRDADQIFAEQISEIIKFACAWKTGEWIFSPLARLRQDIEFPINIQNLLLEHGRALPKESVVRRFKSFNESFGAKPGVSASSDLQPQEAFLLSRFENSFLKIEEIRNLSGLPEMTTLQTIYALWLGGFLYRQNWNPAFSQKKISEINAAKLTLKREDEKPAPGAEQAATKVENKTPAPNTASVSVPPAAAPDPEQILMDYLSHAESAENYYEFLKVPVDAGLSDIKRAYFAIAKQFHPDKFHQEKDAAKLLRIQNAFTQAAQSYETLKDEQTRKTYDYKLGKQLERGKSAPVSAAAVSTADSKETLKEMARQSFEEGFTLLMQEEYNEALPYLARAVQYAPDNARYHAYFGKLLSTDEAQRYKADSELQTAIRLDPQNITYRLMAAEFYIEYNLPRRAEGELQRLLALQPNHREARELLDSLR